MTTTPLLHENYAYSFRDDAFIDAFGLGPENALDYFARSDFYDRSCNNEHIRMQHQSLEALKKMVGLEYVLVRTGHEPRLFVVIKQQRLSPEATTKLAIYYILDKMIYQAPNLHMVCVSRIRKTCEALSAGFDLLENENLRSHTRRRRVSQHRIERMRKHKRARILAASLNRLVQDAGGGEQ
jgi:hypothetical protein